MKWDRWSDDWLILNLSGLRCVGPAGLDCEQHGREGLHAEQEPEGVRGDRQREAAAGERVQGGGLVRGHTCVRRKRQCRVGM